MTDNKISEAQELAAGFINIAEACETDTNTLFLALSMAVCGGLAGYYQQQGAELTLALMQEGLEKIHKQMADITNSMLEASNK